MRIKPKILFIGDPIQSLNLASDTSLAFCESALNLDFDVFWCEKKDISFFNYEILVNQAAVLTKVSIAWIKCCDFSNKSFDPAVTPQDHKVAESIPFSEFTYCFIRPDPPFDATYTDLCWILNTQSKVKIYNPPSALLNFHEKSLHMRAFTEGVLKKHNLIPTCVSESIEVVKEFLNAHVQKGVEKFITKPWLGYAGMDVMLWDNTNALLEFVHGAKDKLIVQPFLEEIHTVGDRRVLIVNGEVVCSFVRLPPKDKIASNLARGGSSLLREMTPAQERLCQNLGEFLIQHSIVLAGVDLIGEKVGEINITSPTGFCTYEKMSGIPVIQKAFEMIIKN